MPRLTQFIVLCATSLFGILLITKLHPAKAEELIQIPTVSIPTVTGTPEGSSVTVTLEQDQINVRSGPSTDYPIIGVLIAGQKVPALGRSEGGNWIQIIYPGASDGLAWVYSPLVTMDGVLPIVEPPPTPTPRTTPTIDPTLAAQFIVEIPPTRLPTFTPPPDLVIPTIQAGQSSAPTGRVPMGLVIIGLVVVGLFGTLISFLRGR